jgi:hypothetical protein
VNTASPCSYLCKEAMDALLKIDNNNNNNNKELDYQPTQLTVVIQTEGIPLQMYLSLLKTPGDGGKPGRFHDVNVLGMDFLETYGLSMVVDTPLYRFKLVKKELTSLLGDYDEDVL